MKRNYPYQAWVLLPSFKPKEVTITKNYGARGTHTSEWEQVQSGKTYHKDNLYPSKEAAINAGFKMTEQQQADIDKRQVNLNKRIESLVKARQS